MQKCTICKLDLPFDKFHKHKSRPTGHITQCKACLKLKRQTRTPTQKAIRAAKAKEWAESNKENLSKYRKEYYAANKETLLDKCKEYKKKRPHLNAKKSAAFRAHRNKANCSNWIDYKFNTIQIDNLYLQARHLTKLTGITYTVDHVIPLKGELVCGLHHYTNLQILTKSENSSKCNKFTVG